MTDRRDGGGDPALRARTHRLRAYPIDDLAVLGLTALALWTVLSGFWILRGRPGHLLWLSDVALLATAIGFLFRSRVLLTAQFAGVLVFHLAWHVDLATWAVTGGHPVGATSYMAGFALTPAEQALSLMQHLFVIPATSWGILRLGASRRGWLVQAVVAGAVLGLSYLLTEPGHGVNVAGGGVLTDLLPSRGRGSYYALLVLVPPLLLYLPANLLAVRLARCPLARRLRDRGPGWRRAVAGGGALALAATSVAFVSAARGGPTIADRSLDLSLHDLQALPVATGGLAVEEAVSGAPGQDGALPLLIHSGPLPATPGLRGIVKPARLEALLEGPQMEAVPPAPGSVVLRGHAPNGTRVGAIVVSDRPYPQPRVDTVTSSSFELRVQLGPEPPGTGPGGGSGGASWQLYAIAVVAVDPAGAMARTGYLLFKRRLPDAATASRTREGGRVGAPPRRPPDLRTSPPAPAGPAAPS